MSHHITRGARSSLERTGDPIQVVLVSGFLGAGKTTALQAIGERLTDRGFTVGMITNDQASGLVDTSILERTDGTVLEIPGGCFCCNFTDLLSAANTIRRRDVNILLAEPVGSCTDLVATVINPLRSMYAEEFSVTPLTTILDPARVQSYLTDDDGALPEAVRYIFRMQVEEADVIALNKTDTLTDAERSQLVGELKDRVGNRPVIPVSAKQRDGIDMWLSAIVDGIEPDGELNIDGVVSAEHRALTDIDYDTYAEGEARLGWVNMTVTLDGSFDASQFQTALMTHVRRTLQAKGIEVAHLKFSISTDDGLSHANLTSTGSEPSFSGVGLGAVKGARLLVNARAVGDPREIRTVARDAITETATPDNVSVTIEETQAFRPEYPEPVHRIDGDPDSDPETAE